MSKEIRVLLLERVDRLGVAGDIVVVSNGYARNFLFPLGKAALATLDVQKKQQEIKAKEEKRSVAAVTAQQEIAQRLTGTELTISARRKEGEEIFGSITAVQVAKELNTQAGLRLKAKDIKLNQPITVFGSQDVAIHLSAEAETVIRVTVVPSKEE